LRTTPTWRPCPAWLVEVLTARPEPTDGHTGGFAGLPEVIRGKRADISGERHETLVRYACSLRAREVPLDEATVLMWAAWRRCEQPPACETPLPWDEAVEKLHDVYARYPAGWSEGYQHTTPAVLDDPQNERTDGVSATRMVDGAAFVLDVPTSVPCIWGRGDDVIRAEGESLMVTGPPGVGKTTVMGQLTRARIGLVDDLLGYPVAPTAGRVLYLAMDRPAQIARSLRRHFREDERAVLTDDEVGAAYNRARQLATAEGVQLVELHHMVKRGPSGAKPTTLADVYGSVWLTAGAGSVVLLWGAAGDPIVEWHHLKQPAAEVGPFRVAHDHAAGLSEIFRSLDLIDVARKSGPHGLSIKAAAQALFSTDKPNDNQIKKAQRRLDGLVPDYLTVHEVARPTGGKPQRRYLPSGVLFALEQPREQSRPSSAESNTEPFPSIPPGDETPGQSNPAQPPLYRGRGSLRPQSASTVTGRSTLKTTAASAREMPHEFASRTAARPNQALVEVHETSCRSRNHPGRPERPTARRRVVLRVRPARPG
jgi:AAA domain